jgi:hypothetical protein
VRVRIFSIIFFALLMCGCQTKVNLGRAIVQQVALYGGHTQTTNAIPELRGFWNVKSADTESFQAHLFGVPFAEVKSFMQRVYGDPVSVTDAHDWRTPGHIYYRAADIGVAIEFFGESNGVGLKCQRGHAYPDGPLPSHERSIIL